jgi:hypothetical protein
LIEHAPVHDVDQPIVAIDERQAIPPLVVQFAEQLEDADLPFASGSSTLQNIFFRGTMRLTLGVASSRLNG